MVQFFGENRIIFIQTGFELVKSFNMGTMELLESLRWLDKEANTTPPISDAVVYHYLGIAPISLTCCAVVLGS
jgi:hypothetical protein